MGEYRAAALDSMRKWVCCVNIKACNRILVSNPNSNTGRRWCSCSSDWTDALTVPGSGRWQEWEADGRITSNMVILYSEAKRTTVMNINGSKKLYNLKLGPAVLCRFISAWFTWMLGTIILGGKNPQVSVSWRPSFVPVSTSTLWAIFVIIFPGEQFTWESSYKDKPFEILWEVQLVHQFHILFVFFIFVGFWLFLW